jgi:hypothetical protein
MPGWVGSRAGAVRKAPVSIPRPFDGAYRFPVRPSRAGFLPSAYSGDREGGQHDQVGRESDRDVGKTQSGLNRRESVPASAADRAATPGATPQAPGRRPPVLLLTRYFAYYHQARTHLALDKDAHFGHRDQSDRSIVITPIGGS